MCGAKSFLVIAELVSRMIPGGNCIKDDAGDGLCTNVNSAFEGTISLLRLNYLSINRVILTS